MNKTSKFVRGVGTKGNKYPSKRDGKVEKEYSLWSDMLRRCTENGWNKRPTYTGTTCSENFKSYSYFYEWCHNQIGFDSKDENGNRWHLDKDILIQNNKIYSEDTCAFVPAKINLLLIKCKATRGELPIGVDLNKRDNKFRSVCSKDGKMKFLGCFNTPQEAFQAYKTFKEALIKEVANEYKEMLDSRVYEALMNYEVNEND